MGFIIPALVQAYAQDYYKSMPYGVIAAGVSAVFVASFPDIRMPHKANDNPAFRYRKIAFRLPDQETIMAVLCLSAFIISFTTMLYLSLPKFPSLWEEHFPSKYRDFSHFSLQEKVRSAVAFFFMAFVIMLSFYLSAIYCAVAVIFAWVVASKCIKHILAALTYLRR
ncbi:hypothetical protein D2T31_04620 [Sinirhodobacter populi]|uniref:Uncharacterized protein n=1 Tax=Paenirhodobacter populi TaxID=2306993 RepID=A0A443KF85_9RHOB|nr:hypothetical protein [Sinirhodobacter populi]RWR31293.1 hypothetical protein D2T31_04620 [Sinirhodobacter populi]